jgi:asparagine synthase (glutamine-hydrolysing)
MCGIAGFVSPSGFGLDSARSALQAMSVEIRHRGPDDAGEWLDPSAGVALAHRRLSIVDLSPAGHQPMHSACGRYVVVFNGEIYNAPDLRRLLEAQSLAPDWKGHSDTEVMLAAFSAWGIDATIRKLNGMFAIALWDKRERILTLVRDRLGKKPLYYARVGGSFVFGSELKAMCRFADWDSTVDRAALALYMRYGYIPAPWTIYSAAKKVPAGAILTLHGGDIASARIEQYWSPLVAAERGLADPLVGSEEEALAQVEAVLADAVRIRSVADVPVGVFLSGGIDSSLVAALMQTHSSQRIRTFSIGFRESEFDEAPFAQTIARHLGTDHTELYVSAQDALDVVPLLPRIYDEPFADPSEVPTYLVSKLARAHVTVALAGDGGDEVFCGYGRYFLGAQRWSRLRKVPIAARRACAALLRNVPAPAWQAAAAVLGLRRPSHGPSSPLPTRALGLADLLSAETRHDIGGFMMSVWRRPEEVVRDSREPLSTYLDSRAASVTPTVEEMMMLSDLLQYLPDDILVKTDRASMAVALEVRAPLLDYRLVELSWRLPLRMKRSDGKGKLPLRRLLEKHVPAALFDRPKMGFGIPLETWLRGPLQDWAEALLAPRRLEDDGLFDVTKVRERWVAHRSGVHNWSPHLWHVLMVQAWLDTVREMPTSRERQLATAAL